MKNEPAAQNESSFKITTAKYLSFFKKIASHQILSQNNQLLHITELCIALAEKTLESSQQYEHEQIHQTLKSCMKTIQEAFLLMIEKKPITAKLESELGIQIENLKSPALLTQVNLVKSKNKGSAFRQFLENGRNQHLISVSPDSFEDIQDSQTNDFKRDVEKILNPSFKNESNTQQSTPSKTKLMVILITVLLLTSAAFNIWLVLQNTKTH